MRHFVRKIRAYLCKLKITNIEKLIEYLRNFDGNEKEDDRLPPQETLIKTVLNEC